jgi:uncharacterized protein (TIGR03435 family)
VHQGDQNGVKGLYHINAVDEVTQWEIVAGTPQISEYWLIPLLEQLLEQFPFMILGFHSDNGSEFINYIVKELVEKLLIEQTKSRAYRAGDNGVVESKNGAIIRKHIGFGHMVPSFPTVPGNRTSDFHIPTAPTPVPSYPETKPKGVPHYRPSFSSSDSFFDETMLQQDAPLMLRALLQDRFKLAAHTANVERSILALVVDKGGPKLNESAEAAPPIDNTAPLKPREIRIETPDGSVIMAAGKAGGLAFRLGANGSLAYSVDLATGAMHTEGTALTMAGFAIILTQSSQDLDDHGPPVIDETGLHGHYQFAIDYQRPDSAEGSAGPVSGSLMEAVRRLGLKLEGRKAMVDQLVLDHAEKTPTAN